MEENNENQNESKKEKEELNSPLKIIEFQRGDFPDVGNLDSPRIGSGGFGNVYLSPRAGEDKPLYAVKVLKSDNNSQTSQDFSNEVHTLSQLNYPTILTLIGVKRTYPYFIVTEYLPNGSVQSIIKKISEGEEVDFDNTHKFIIILGITWYELLTFKKHCTSRFKTTKYSS